MSSHGLLVCGSRREFIASNLCKEGQSPLQSLGGSFKWCPSSALTQGMCLDPMSRPPPAMRFETRPKAFAPPRLVRIWSVWMGAVSVYYPHVIHPFIVWFIRTWHMEINIQKLSKYTHNDTTIGIGHSLCLHLHFYASTAENVLRPQQNDRKVLRRYLMRAASKANG